MEEGITAERSIFECKIKAELDTSNIDQDFEK